jgi:hypothetical protein
MGLRTCILRVRMWLSSSTSPYRALKESSAKIHLCQPHSASVDPIRQDRVISMNSRGKLGEETQPYGSGTLLAAAQIVDAGTRARLFTWSIAIWYSSSPGHWLVFKLSNWRFVVQLCLQPWPSFKLGYSIILSSTAWRISRAFNQDIGG